MILRINLIFLIQSNIHVRSPPINKLLSQTSKVLLNSLLSEHIIQWSDLCVRCIYYATRSMRRTFTNNKLYIT